MTAVERSEKTEAAFLALQRLTVSWVGVLVLSVW